MISYLAILKIRMKVLFQYRAATLAGIFTQLFWGIIQIMILHAFYASVSGSEPISFSQAVNFIWIGQALLQLLPWSLDKEIEGQIKSGNVAYDLIRPLHMYGVWFMRSLAMRLVPTLMRCFPIFIIGGWLFGLQAPISLQAGIAFLFSVIFAILLSTSITTIVLISLFWTLSGEGIQRLLPHCAVLFSGMVVPLPLFPSWSQPFLNVQPFRGVVDIPCRIYMGIIPTSDAIYFLAFQLIWIAVFVILGRFLTKKALRQFVIQGG